MKKIYVVTDGSYSDYHIVGIFDSLHKAQIIQAKYNCDDIEIYTLNPGIKELYEGKTFYRVGMYRDGTVYTCSEEQDNGSDMRTFISKGNRYYPKTILNTYTWANDKEHAIKIVNEKRTQLIANGEWENEKK